MRVLLVEDALSIAKSLDTALTHEGFTLDGVATLGVTMDSPEVVAQAFITFLKSGKTSEHIGWPEHFFVWLNKTAPQLASNALAKQLPTIKKFAAS